MQSDALGRQTWQQAREDRALFTNGKAAVLWVNVCSRIDLVTMLGRRWVGVVLGI